MELIDHNIILLFGIVYFFSISVCIPMELETVTLGIARFFMHWIHVQVLVDCSLSLNDFLKVIL